MKFVAFTILACLATAVGTLAKPIEGRGYGGWGSSGWGSSGWGSGSSDYYTSTSPYYSTPTSYTGGADDGSYTGSDGWCTPNITDIYISIYNPYTSSSFWYDSLTYSTPVYEFPYSEHNYGNFWPVLDDTTGYFYLEVGIETSTIWYLTVSSTDYSSYLKKHYNHSFSKQLYQFTCSHCFTPSYYGQPIGHGCFITNYWSGYCATADGFGLPIYWSQCTYTYSGTQDWSLYYGEWDTTYSYGLTSYSPSSGSTYGSSSGSTYGSSYGSSSGSSYGYGSS